MAGDHKQARYDEIFAELRKYYSEEQIGARLEDRYLARLRPPGPRARRAGGRRLVRNSGQDRIRLS